MTESTKRPTHLVIPRPLLVVVLNGLAWFDFLAPLGPLGAADVQVRPKHPRLYMRSGDATALRQRVHSSTTVGDRYGNNPVQYVQPLTNTRFVVVRDRAESPEDAQFLLRTWNRFRHVQRNPSE